MNWLIKAVLTVSFGTLVLTFVFGAAFVATVNTTYLPLLGLLAGAVIAMLRVSKRTSKH